jgi:hypothetical protein
MYYLGTPPENRLEGETEDFIEEYHITVYSEQNIFEVFNSRSITVNAFFKPIKPPMHCCIW